MEVKVEGETIVMRRWNGDREALILFNFGEEDLSLPSGWEKLLDSTEERWGGRGSGGRSLKVLVTG